MEHFWNVLSVPLIVKFLRVIVVVNTGVLSRLQLASQYQMLDQLILFVNCLVSRMTMGLLVPYYFLGLQVYLLYYLWKLCSTCYGVQSGCQKQIPA